MSFGIPLGLLGSHLGPLGNDMRPFGSHLGSFGITWTIWESFGIILESFRTFWESFGNHLGPFGTIWMFKVPDQRHGGHGHS